MAAGINRLPSTMKNQDEFTGVHPVVYLPSEVVKVIHVLKKLTDGESFRSYTLEEAKKLRMVNYRKNHRGEVTAVELLANRLKLVLGPVIYLGGILDEQQPSTEGQATGSNDWKQLELPLTN